MPVVTSPEAACGHCSYFDKKAATCHYNPPSATASWPKVAETDWCGHYVAEEAA